MRRPHRVGCGTNSWERLGAITIPAARRYREAPLRGPPERSRFQRREGPRTQDPDGLTAFQAMQLVRAVAIHNEVVAADFMEYNPFMDDAHQTTGVPID